MTLSKTQQEGLPDVTLIGQGRLKARNAGIADVIRSLEYDAGFTLLPGKYLIKFPARDDETGRIGTYQASFNIPNLNKVVDQVPISSVVLSGQRVKLTDAVYSAQKGKEQAKANAVDPLVRDGEKLILSVTRVFTRSRPLYVYFQGYEAMGSATRPLVAFVSLYRNGAKVLSAQPAAITPPSTAKLAAVPFQFEIPLNTLDPGEYECQVTVMDPNGGKASFWREPVQIVP